MIATVVGIAFGESIITLLGNGLDTLTLSSFHYYLLPPPLPVPI